MPVDTGIRHRRRVTAVASGIVVSLAAVQVASAIVPYQTPRWTRPNSTAAASANRSTYQVFDSFIDDEPESWTVEMNEPDGPNYNPNGNATFHETSGNAFVAGSGNLYNLRGPIEATIHVPGYAPITGASTSFLVQMETQGTELVRGSVESGGAPTDTFDFSGFSINGTPLTSLREFGYTELSRTELPGGAMIGGYVVQHAFAFTLPAAATGYDFTLKSREFHMSVAYTAVDTFVRKAGDFNYDGVRDVKDLDLLMHATTATPAVSVPLFDVNNDGSLTTAQNANSDADAWVMGLANTRYGDSDLDGDVDFADLLTLAKSYNASGSAITWSKGDFNGNSIVGFEDLLALAKNYNYRATAAGAADASAFSATFASDWTLAQSLVPEPTSLATLAMTAGALLSRRRVTR